MNEFKFAVISNKEAQYLGMSVYSAGGAILTAPYDYEVTEDFGEYGKHSMPRSGYLCKYPDFMRIKIQDTATETQFNEHLAHIEWLEENELI